VSLPSGVFRPMRGSEHGDSCLFPKPARRGTDISVVSYDMKRRWLKPRRQAAILFVRSRSWAPCAGKSLYKKGEHRQETTLPRCLARLKERTSIRSANGAHGSQSFCVAKAENRGPGL